MTASFFLAIDVGTSRTAAATARAAADGTVAAAPFALGRNGDSAPSVIFVGDGELLFGDAAVRRGIAHPERFIREFKRRIGDDVPIIADDRRFPPEQLYARMVTWVIDTVTEREGRPPAAVSLAVPVTWTEFRTELVRSALAREGWGDIVLISEPVAAARHYEFERPLAAGGLLAVYDLGGGTFDAVVLRKSDPGQLSVVGAPGGIAGFGGSDLDDIVLRHALAAAGLTSRELTANPTDYVALAGLRRECVDAKESLSFDTEAVVPVLVGAAGATVRLTRSEFEGMIEAGIARTIDVLADAFDSTAVDIDDVEAILLTGGSSRIPRVAQMLSERFDRPIAVDADPKAIVSLGAARAVAAGHHRALALVGDDSIVRREAAPADGSAGVLSPAPVPGKARRKWFGLGAAASLTGGALMLAAGITVSVGYPLMGDASSATDPQATSTRQSTPVTEPPAGPEASSPELANTDAAYESLRESLRVLLAQRMSTVAVSSPAPSATPLLSPAPPSARIYNVAVPEPTASEPSSTTSDAPARP